MLQHGSYSMSSIIWTGLPANIVNNYRSIRVVVMRTIILFPLFLLIFSTISCANRVEVPETITVNTPPVTGEITVKHIITLQLPTIFTDSCKSQFPDDEVAYNACITEYINSLLTLINGLNPGQLPQTGLNPEQLPIEGPK